ncbi:MAG: hypothetical protein N2C14_00210, partial [Planctomycetales bacterium]
MIVRRIPWLMVLFGLAAAFSSAQPPEKPLPEGAVARIGDNDGSDGLPGVYRVLFSPDGKKLATRGADHIVRLWSIETGKQTIPPIDGHTDRVSDLAFSLDGKTLATAADGEEESVLFWDAATGNRAGQVKGGARVIRFLPDRESLAAAGAERFGRYEATTGTELSKTPLS